MRGVDPTPHDHLAAGFGLDMREPTPPRSPAALLAEAATALPQLARLVYRLLRDPAVPLRRKLVAAAAVGYVIAPIDLIPDFIPALGRMDDLVMVALAIHLLIESVPENVQREYWEGSEDALELVRALLAWGAEMIPERLRKFLA